MHDQLARPTLVLPGPMTPSNGTPESSGEDRPPPRTAAMRRRIIVFSIVFGLCALLSLAYTFMRPAIYMASARLQVTPGAKLTAPTAAARDSTPAVLVEVQVLNSRPLLEKVAARLSAEGERFDGAADPIAALQEMLRISRVDESNVILIEAVDGQRQRVARVVNALVDSYREQQTQAGKSDNQSDLSDAREELRIVEQRVNERRRAVEAFRLKSNIVSAERDENRTLSRLKGLGASLSAATDREAIATGKVHALEQAVATGQRSPQAKETRPSRQWKPACLNCARSYARSSASTRRSTLIWIPRRARSRLACQP